MNLRLLSKVLGLLLILLGTTMVLCAGYGYYAGEHRDGFDPVEAFGLAITVTTGTGCLMALAGRGSGREILRKEGIAIVGLGWLICGAFGALPYLFSKPGLGLVDALFESISGFTTTGASVITDLDKFPRSILLWRSFTQWLGGVGILVLFVALLSYLGVGSKALFGHESSAKTGEGLRARTTDVAARMWTIYLGLSVLCCLGLMGFGMSFFEAVCHTFTALSTGGFSPENTSIAAYSSLAIELWLVLFMLLGSMSFLLYAWLLRGKWERWQREEEARWFLMIVALATGIVALDLNVAGGQASLSALRDSLFQVVSIVTTTGFATADFDTWPPFSKIILLGLMVLGGCAGSTAGGLKVGRWLLFARLIRQQVISAYRPNQVFALRLNGQHVEADLRMQTLFLIALAAVFVFLGTLVVSLQEPLLDIDSSLSAVMACLFNIGPGLGQVGPTQNFAFLANGTKLLLCWFMVLGRLEFFAVLVLFAPSLWRRY